MKTWVKLYTEIIDDPKMRPFTWAQKGIWAALLALGGKLDMRNGEGAETGELYSVEDTAWAIRCDLEEFTEAIAAFSRPAGEDEKPMLCESDGVLFITNYPKRQARPPSQQREAVRQRVANHRARKRNEDVTRLHQAVTPSESESETDTDTESDQSQSQSRLVTKTASRTRPKSGLRPISDLISPSFSSDSDSLTDAARIEKAISIRERAERGKLSAREEAQMRQWANEYGPAVLYEATRRTAFKKPDNFGAYLRKTLEQIGKPRDPP